MVDNFIEKISSVVRKSRDNRKTVGGDAIAVTVSREESKAKIEWVLHEEDKTSVIGWITKDKTSGRYAYVAPRDQERLASIHIESYDLATFCYLLAKIHTGCEHRAFDACFEYLRDLLK